MRARRALVLSIYLGGGGSGLAPALPAAEVMAGSPVEVAVTVYRAPDRLQGSIELDDLNGFALISETRVVRLPAGESRLRFEGVADGIEAQSTIITGLAEAVMEKNRDATVLSPSALVAAAAGEFVELTRTNRKTGRTERVRGTILSDAGGGVIFSTSEGIEALRCSGLPESIDFELDGLPAARPSLSVKVRTATAVTSKVTLSYLSRGFDWAADYSATLSPDEHSMDLGAWVTLANSNGTGFPAARTQVVAGRVNREREAVEPIDLGRPILARCWPRGSTSDSPPRDLRVAKEDAIRRSVPMTVRAAPASALVVTAQQVEQEQLGDLKLYRVPERTTVAARQSKQVRLLDRAAIPVTTFYRAEVSSRAAQTAFAAERMLRARNDAASHLGLPLPSGNIAVFSRRGAEPFLLHESSMRDLAVNEELEIGLGPSPDVQVSVVHEKAGSGPAPAREQEERVQVTNALPQPVQLELRVALDDGARVARADRPLDSRSGKPAFRVTVPARGSTFLHYRLRYRTAAMLR